MEQALERAAHCRFKSKLDKRGGFSQVELTKREQDLSVFIAPSGQVSTFQELMNQILACMKLKPTMQALLKKGGSH